MSIPAAVFKAECLKLMDEVARTGQTIVITKHGKPVAQQAPVPAAPGSLFGYMKNSMTLKGDITLASADSWSAVSGDEDHLYRPVRKKSRVRAATPKR